MPLMARRIASRGWHVQLHVMDAGGRAPLAEMETVLINLTADVVIDHMGSLSAPEGIGQPGFQALLRLVGSGRCWVKLSAAYRMSAVLPPYDDRVPFVHALLSVRLLWASDWPHVSFKGLMPDTADLLDQLFHWVPDEQQRKRILVDNPAAL